MSAGRGPLPPTKLFEKIPIPNDKNHRTTEVAIDVEYIRRCRSLASKIIVFAVFDFAASFLMSGLALLPFRIILLLSAAFRFLRARRLMFDKRSHAGKIGVIRMYWYRQQHASVDVHSLPALKKFSLITQNGQSAEYQFLTIVFIALLAAVSALTLLVYLCVTEHGMLRVILFSCLAIVGLVFEYYKLATFYEQQVVASVETHLPSSRARRHYAKAASIYLINKAVAKRNKIYKEYTANPAVVEPEVAHLLDLQYTPEYRLMASQPAPSTQPGFSNSFISASTTRNHLHQL